MEIGKSIFPQKLLHGHMLDLNWSEDDLKNAKELLQYLDQRGSDYYKHLPKYVMKSDLAEREHLRNTIKYYEDKQTRNP